MIDLTPIYAEKMRLWHLLPHKSRGALFRYLTQASSYRPAVNRLKCSPTLKAEIIRTISRLRYLKRLCEPCGNMDCSPHRIAKILNTDTSVIYRVLVQYAKTRSTLFSGDRIFKQTSTCHRALARQENVPRRSGTVPVFQGPLCTFPCAVPALRTKASRNPASTETFSTHFRTEVGQNDDCPPLWFKRELSEPERRKNFMMRSSINTAKVLSGNITEHDLF